MACLAAQQLQWHRLVGKRFSYSTSTLLLMLARSSDGVCAVAQHEHIAYAMYAVVTRIEHCNAISLSLNSTSVQL
jgi:hypothetical protein